MKIFVAGEHKYLIVTDTLVCKEPCEPKQILRMGGKN